MINICMIVQDPCVKGGISAVVNGYRTHGFGVDYNIIFVESYKDGGKLEKLAKAIKGYFDFIKVAAKEQIDIVHIHSSFGPSFFRKIPFVLMASLINIPVINHVHGADFDSFYSNASTAKKKIVHYIYNRCDRMVVLSDKWKERISLIVPSNKISVIENYSIIHPQAAKSRRIKKNSKQILFLGELGMRKGCFDIPLIASRVISAVPDASFILAGAGNATDEGKIKTLIEQLHLADRFIFPGWVRAEKKDELLKESDIFLLPSYNEGMPMSILDAMGYGLPIVSTDVGGISRIVKNNYNGYCLTAGDVDSISDAIIVLLNDDAKLKEYGERSFIIAESQYSLEAHVQQIRELYQEIIEEQR